MPPVIVGTGGVSPNIGSDSADVEFGIHCPNERHFLQLHFHELRLGHDHHSCRIQGRRQTAFPQTKLFTQNNQKDYVKQGIQNSGSDGC